jgi:hypothetical protein
VEVDPVLDPSEKAVFDGMVSEMRAEDPTFTHRVERLCRPRRQIRLVLAVLLWIVAPISIVVGGWTGVFMAVAAAGYGAHLYAKRDIRDGGTVWPSPGRRPGVSN